MQIPYEVKPRPDTGLYNAKVGIWLFLASEIMLFGGLFSAYVFLRLGAAPATWPNYALDWTWGLLNTAVLIASSVSVVLAWACIKLNQYRNFKLAMYFTLACALTFIVIKGTFEYKKKFEHHGVFIEDVQDPKGWAFQITGHVKKEKSGPDSNYIYLAPDAPKKQPWNWYSAQEVYGTGDYLEKTDEGTDGQEPATHPFDHFNFDHPGIEKTSEEYHGHPVLKIAKDSIARVSREYDADGNPIEGSEQYYVPFTPRYNSFFAIYYTMTGLHALHVIGGALVLAYFAGPGSKMFFTNREHFANRVEVAGLFWHFVDLVWIFLFPILYLM
jgi:cytochrome c oxidase subunit 3